MVLMFILVEKIIFKVDKSINKKCRYEQYVSSA